MRHCQSRDLHTKFAISCVQQLSSFLEQDAVAKLWRAKTSSYSSSKTVSTQSYFAYFVSTTPDSESKRCRIKTVLFLQGSSLYDLETVKVRLMAHEKMLKLEIAILHAKVRVLCIWCFVKTSCEDTNYSLTFSRCKTTEMRWLP